MINGEGVRVTLFVSGCEHACPGCYNKSTWSPASGEIFTEDHLQHIITLLSPDYVRGLSLTGGDPLHDNNLGVVESIIARVNRVYQGTKNIWLWTGYTLQEMSGQRLSVAQSVDVLIDGKYVERLKDARLPFRGSSNQIIHRFKL